MTLFSKIHLSDSEILLLNLHILYYFIIEMKPWKGISSETRMYLSSVFKLKMTINIMFFHACYSFFVV